MGKRYHICHSATWWIFIPKRHFCITNSNETTHCICNRTFKQLQYYVVEESRRMKSVEIDFPPQLSIAESCHRFEIKLFSENCQSVNWSSNATGFTRFLTRTFVRESDNCFNSFKSDWCKSLDRILLYRS